MSKKGIIAIILVAVLSFGCGLAGGLYSSEIKEALNLKPLGISRKDSSHLTDLRNASTIEGGNVTEDEEGNIIINVSGDYSLSEAIAEKLMPSVVSVTTSYDVSYSYFDFFGWGNNGGVEEQSCVGTGFIVDSNGYLLTNSHVVNDGNYKKILISLYGGEELEGQVLWNDSNLDLAIVKVNASGLKAVELGDSDALKIGSYAAAIGNPLGLTFERSMSQGIISGLNRTITVSSGSSGSGTTMEGLLQTDAAINSGNSGGPLLNSKGEVVGIASARASSGEAMGFAIPINVAKPIIKQIKEKGSFERVYMGITAIGVEQMSTRSAASIEEQFGTKSGIYISTVTKGGGADKAGLKAGDIIISVNGTPVGTMNKLQTVLVNFVSGDKVGVCYLRDKKEYKAEIVLLNQDQLNSLPQ